MKPLVADTTGLVHLISSIVALISGTLVLVLRKGNSIHKKIGYVYVGSMTILIISAFMIYRLFGGFGVFHGFAILSVLALTRGMVPVIKRNTENYLYQHFRGMYWSVIGLYAAFIAEIAVRLPVYKLFSTTPSRMFFNLTFASIAFVMIVAGLCFRKKKEQWQQQFRK